MREEGGGQSACRGQVEGEEITRVKMLRLWGHGRRRNAPLAGMALVVVLLHAAAPLVSPFATSRPAFVFSPAATRSRTVANFGGTQAAEQGGGSGWGGAARGQRTCSPVSRPLVGGSSLFGRQLPTMASRHGVPTLLHRRGMEKARWTCLYGSFNDDSLDDGDDGWDDGALDEDNEEDDRMVLLRDVAMDRVIECFIDREVEVNGKMYATLMPADTPVILAGYDMVNGTQQLVPILEDDEIDKLFDTASAVLAEVDLMLSRSAVVLTVEGGMVSEDSYDLEDSDDEDEDDDDFSITFMDEGLDDDEDENFNAGPVSLRIEELVDPSRPRRDDLFYDSDDDEDDSENEKVQVLATFYFDGRRHVVAAPLEPVLIIGAPSPAAAQVPDYTEELEGILGEKLNKELMPSSSDSDDDDDALDGLSGAFEVLEYTLPDRAELEIVTPMIEKELETMHKSEVQEKRKLLNLRASLQQQWNSAPNDDS